MRLPLSIPATVGGARQLGTAGFMLLAISIGGVYRVAGRSISELHSRLGMIDATLLTQLKTLIAEYDSLASTAKYEDLSDLPEAEVVRLKMRCESALNRIAGGSSAYSNRITAILRSNCVDSFELLQLFAIAKALRDDIEAGYLKSFAELIHGEVFGDFLEMAKHLLDEGYKDAAAVIAGSTLEGHLRQLCVKHSVSTTTPTANGDRPKKAEALNSELVAAGAYDKTDQKSVTAQLGIRNDAAHGHYTNYQAGQVEVMITAVRDFMTRVRA